MRAARKVVFLNAELLERIDSLRGDMSREDFIRACVEACTEGEEPKEEPRYVTREEFISFQKKLSDFLAALINFFLGYTVKEENKEKIEKLKEFFEPRENP